MTIENTLLQILDRASIISDEIAFFIEENEVTLNIEHNSDVLFLFNALQSDRLSPHPIIRKVRYEYDVDSEETAEGLLQEVKSMDAIAFEYLKGLLFKTPESYGELALLKFLAQSTSVRRCPVIKGMYHCFANNGKWFDNASSPLSFTDKQRIKFEYDVTDLLLEYEAGKLWHKPKVVAVLDKQSQQIRWSYLS